MFQHCPFGPGVLTLAYPNVSGTLARSPVCAEAAVAAETVMAPVQARAIADFLINVIIVFLLLICPPPRLAALSVRGKKTHDEEDGFREAALPRARGTSGRMLNPGTRSMGVEPYGSGHGISNGQYRSHHRGGAPRGR